MKIQQMAFVLVALMIFFSLVLLFYFMIRTSNLEEGALVFRGEEAQELVRSLAGAGEFAWSATDCAGCIDLDKTLIVKDRQAYQGFWKLDFLQFEVLGAETDRECSKFNYPDCSKISVLGEEKGFGDVVSSYVALCRYENEKGGYTRCDLGRIHVSGKGINNNA
jgi:hypothetical protein